MKRIIITLLAMLLVMPASWAQTEVTKEIKKQAKAFKKEGWAVVEGEKSMEEQLADLQRYMNDSCYVVESSSRIASSYRMGYHSAEAMARGALVRRLNTFVSRETNMIQTNTQGGDGESESQQALESRIRNISQETLRNAFPVLAISRQLPDGTCEVQVHLAIALPETLK